MGDMGQRKRVRNQKRKIGKRRPSRKGRPVLAWLPDSIRPNSPAGKAALNSWLGRSFLMSNKAVTVEAVLAEEYRQDALMILGDTARTFADPGSTPEISIESPESGYPVWGAKVEMVIDGELKAIEIESASLDDVVHNTLGWMNGSALK